jgi:hypothetical protein
MTVSAQQLVDDTRVISGLRNNPLFSDTQILSLLNDGYGEARDKFVVAVEHWFRASVPFELPGGGLPGNSLGSNTFDLSTVADFQMDQGVNWLPGGNSPPIPIPRMGSFAERGYINPGLGWNFGGQREYFTNGDSLFINPYQNSVGSYELIYTPLGTPLAIPQPPPGTAPVLASFENNPSGGIVHFTGTDFTSANEGDTMISAGDGNSQNNFVSVILEVFSSTVVKVVPVLADEASPTATITIQPQGTRSDLPAVQTQLALYLKVHAGIAIQTSRKQNTAELQAKLQREETRILSLAKKRTEGVKQPPITRRRRRWGVNYLG